jgi:hypothetical protein
MDYSPKLFHSPTATSQCAYTHAHTHARAHTHTHTHTHTHGVERNREEDIKEEGGRVKRRREKD